MAEKFKRWLVDDMEAGKGTEEEIEADQTVEFGLDGKVYQMDLSTKNATRLRTDMRKWIQYARLITVKQKKPAVPSGTADMPPEQRSAAREWARNNGYPNLSDKGRIPREVMDKCNSRTAS